MKIKPVKFVSAKILSPTDEDDIYSVRAELIARRLVDSEKEPERYFNETISISVCLFDTNLSVLEIEQQAIQKANEFIKSLAATIE